MSETDIANESVLRGVAKLLGLPDVASLAEVKPSGLWRLTQRELLDVARVLGLSKVSRLKKEALLARVWEVLAQAGAGVNADVVAAAGEAGVARAARTEPQPPERPQKDKKETMKEVVKDAAMVKDAVKHTVKQVVKDTVREAIKPITRVTGKADVAEREAHDTGARNGSAAHAPPPARMGKPPAARADARADRGTDAPTPGDPMGPGAPAPSPEEVRESPPGAAHKFEVGEGAEGGLAALRAEADARIPWGYGRDRITAMPVDPDRLYAYWEVTDDAIARTRPALGAGGEGAYLCLRLYDVSGRIFDGTNAHATWDFGVDRAQRQFFFHVGKPSSEALVEVGLKSHEGYFVKIARSGRVIFPRREPAHGGDAEWMTVRVGTGQVEGISTAAHAGAGHGGGHAGGGGGPGGGGGGFHFGEGFADLRRILWGGREGEGEYSYYDRWEEVAISEIDAEVLRSWSWQGDVETSSWTAGPFSYPVAVPVPMRESYSGPVRVFRSGARTHVVYGPWQVVIKGIGARAEREVLGQWEIYRSFSATGWHFVRPGEGVAGGVIPGAGSEARLGASELRLGGASERFRVGASELRLGGASERSFVGASELRYAGASERQYLGASELRLGGASERQVGGASEYRFGGASEYRLGGGSEGRLGGGSEGRLGGGSEGRLGGRGDRPQDILGVTQDLPPPREGAYPHVPPVGSSHE